MHIGPYQKVIMAQLGCTANDASMVEGIMRNHIFHSTLDWQSKAQLQQGAIEAWQLLESEREMFEENYNKLRAGFEEAKQMEASDGQLEVA